MDKILYFCTTRVILIKAKTENTQQDDNLVVVFLTESCNHTFTVFVVVFGRNSSSKEAGSNEDRPVCGRGR